MAVLIHGGSWRARYGKWLMRGLAVDLLRRGWGVWNVEYRRVGAGRGGGGGWPATFADVAAGVELLAEAGPRVDLERVVMIGHSAGGQLALWVADARRLGPGPPQRLRFRGVVSQAGVAAMAQAHAGDRDGSVHAVMGGAPDEVPEHYDAVDPVGQVPLGAPILLVHGVEDTTVSIQRSRTFTAAAREAGDEVDLAEIAGPPGGHSRHLDPGGEAWGVVVRWLETLGV